MQVIPLLSNTNFTETNEFSETTIEYATPVGVLFKDNVVLFAYSKNAGIEISTINRILLKKKKTVYLNLLSFTLSAVIGSTFFFYTLTNLESLFVGVTGLALLVASFFINNAKYFIVINRTNYAFIEVPVKRKDKKEVKRFISLISKKIKKRNNKHEYLYQQ